MWVCVSIVDAFFHILALLFPVLTVTFWPHPIFIPLLFIFYESDRFFARLTASSRIWKPIFEIFTHCVHGKWHHFSLHVLLFVNLSFLPLIFLLLLLFHEEFLTWSHKLSQRLIVTSDGLLICEAAVHSIDLGTAGVHRQIEWFCNFSTFLFQLSVSFPSLLINFEMDVGSKWFVSGGHTPGVLLDDVSDVHETPIIAPESPGFPAQIGGCWLLSHTVRLRVHGLTICKVASTHGSWHARRMRGLRHRAVQLMLGVCISLLHEVLLELLDDAFVLAHEDSWQRFGRSVSLKMTHDAIDGLRMLTYIDLGLLCKLLTCFKYFVRLQEIQMWFWVFPFRLFLLNEDAKFNFVTFVDWAYSLDILVLTWLILRSVLSLAASILSGKIVLLGVDGHVDLVLVVFSFCWRIWNQSNAGLVPTDAPIQIDVKDGGRNRPEIWN